MKTSHRRLNGKGGLEVVEEAIHVLRVAPPAGLACYYVGALPFAIAGLYFWADMSRNPFAADHLAGASLALALLFLWMKFWQTVFTTHMRAQVGAAPVPRWGARRCVRAFLIQAALQPTAVIFLTLATVTVVPIGWIYAFYQNVTVFGDGELPEAMAVVKKSWKHCVLWPGRNYATLLLMLWFGAVVYLNWGTVCLAIPYLLKTLLGIDSVYARSPLSMLNSTFFAAMFCLTFLCLDPILKTAYVLRCFYGESITTGEDLKAELKHLVLPGKAALAAILVSALLASVAGARAADSSPPAESPSSVNPGVAGRDLDRAIEDVIHQPKYTWRMPREKSRDDDTAYGGIGQFFEQVQAFIQDHIKKAHEWLVGLKNRLFPRRQLIGNGPSAVDWGAAISHLLILLLIAVISGLVILLMFMWRRANWLPASVASEAVPVIPDLADESVAADQLPEDGWIKLGRELLERGECRLALRAFYFASLAHLAGHGLITVARFKSNRDYERELRRRGHALPEMLACFAINVTVFDRTWYGMHEVNRDLVGGFLANVEKLKTPK